MRKIIDKNIQEELNSLISTKTEDFIYCIYDNPVVFRSKTNEANVEYCIENNINIIDTGNMGGTIVASSGDIGLAILKYDGWKVGENIIQFLCDKLMSKVPNLRVDGNDLIGEENYKFASYASINVGDRFIYTIVAISINPNIEHIKNICNKPMNKVPKGLSDYGITSEEIKDFIENTIGG